MIILKKGVRIQGVRAEVVLAIQICYGVYQKFGYDMRVTSVIEGKHSRGSIHYMGGAYDLGIRVLKAAERQPVRKLMARNLGPDFDVVLESNHFHIEYQPKDPF